MYVYLTYESIIREYVHMYVYYEPRSYYTYVLLLLLEYELS